jgi:hypothetical protein
MSYKEMQIEHDDRITKSLKAVSVHDPNHTIYQ